MGRPKVQSKSQVRSRIKRTQTSYIAYNTLFANRSILPIMNSRLFFICLLNSYFYKAISCKISTYSTDYTADYTS